MSSSPAALSSRTRLLGWTAILVAVPSAGLATTAVAAAGTTGAATTTRTAAAAPVPAATADHLYVNAADGIVTGVVTPSAPYSVTITNGGVVKATAAGTADSTGTYVAHIRYDAGHGLSIHNGDAVAVTAGGATYRQAVQLSGLLDDVTGVLTGAARPNSTVLLKLHPAGDLSQTVWSGSVPVGSAGTFSTDFSKVVHPAPSALHPAWRGYQASLEDREIAGQAVFRQVQTPNTTIVSTTNLAGAGYLTPGDTVTFSVTRGGVLRTSTTALVDADGIPQAVLTQDIGAGDVLTTTYHDGAGRARTQTLQPFSLTVRVDATAGTISGQTLPSAPVYATYGAGGGQSLIGQADGTGAYVLAMGAHGIHMTANQPVVVDVILDPGFTGVGAGEIETSTPGVTVDAILGQIGGHGLPGGGPVAVRLIRGGSTVTTIRGTSDKSGGFNGLALDHEALPGDQLVATVNGEPIPTFSVGTVAFDGNAVYTGSGPTGWAYAGTASPGRQVTVTVTLATGIPCPMSGVADAVGRWSADVPCALNGDEYVQLVETVVTPGDPAAGSTRYRTQNLVAPDVAITSPGPDSQVGRLTTVSVHAFDWPESLPASQVWLCVDGGWVQALAPPGSSDFSAPLSLSPGVHSLYAVGFDGSAKRDASGHRIFGQSPPRRLVVP